MVHEQTKKITQDYFDSIVNENINEFEMGTQEAVEDAVAQLKSQGCDLSTICKYSRAEQDELLNALKRLSEFIPTLNLPNKEDPSLKAIVPDTLATLKIIKNKFNQDLSFRCLATRMEPVNAYSIFMQFFSTLAPPSTNLDQSADNEFNLLIENFLNTFQSYLHQQADVLDTNGLKSLIKLTSSDEHDETRADVFANSHVLAAILKCINTSCQMCESNRQYFVENGLCENLMKLFIKHKTDDLILRVASQIIRSLLLDDDIRVAFGKSHEHAKFIASQLNGIDVLLYIGLAAENHLSEETLGNLMLTLSKLAVRNEFCQEICDKGGLKFVLKCIEEKHLKNIALLKSALSLLKSICNNDQVKHEATKSNAIELLKFILEKYAANTQICELTCSALSTLLLRNSESSQQLYALEVHRILVQLLSIHMKNPKLIKPCCLALRNSISRNRHLGEKLIELRIEEILRTILSDSENIKCYDEVNAVLRDLGCHCDLKELWTGTGKNLAQD